MKTIALLAALLALVGCAVEPAPTATPEEEETSAALVDALPANGADPHVTHVTTEPGPTVEAVTPSGAQNCAACGPGPQPWNGVAENTSRR